MHKNSEYQDSQKHAVVAESSSGVHIPNRDIENPLAPAKLENHVLSPAKQQTVNKDWEQGRRDKMVDISLEAIKQQIALATVIIGALLTFVEKISAADRKNLPFALVPLALTIVFGIVALQSIAYHMADDSGPFNKKIVRVAGVAQNVSFIIAVVTMVLIIWS